MKQKIDLSNYLRRSTYEAFRNHDVPVLSVTCDVDMSAFYRIYRKSGLKFFPLLLLAIHRSINEVEAFRHRIESDGLYAYDEIKPSFTILRSDDTISFCDAETSDDMLEFYRNVVAVSEKAMQHADVEMRDKSERYFISNIPWLKFSSFTHPFNATYASIPIVTTGKYEMRGDSVAIPVALQAHHALVDGYHVGQFYEGLSRHLNDTHHLLGPLVGHVDCGSG